MRNTLFLLVVGLSSAGSMAMMSQKFYRFPDDISGVNPRHWTVDEERLLTQIAFSMMAKENISQLSANDWAEIQAKHFAENRTVIAVRTHFYKLMRSQKLTDHLTFWKNDSSVMEGYRLWSANNWRIDADNNVSSISPADDCISVLNFTMSDHFPPWTDTENYLLIYSLFYEAANNNGEISDSVWKDIYSNYFDEAKFQSTGKTFANYRAQLDRLEDADVLKGYVSNQELATPKIGVGYRLWLEKRKRRQ